MEPAPGGAGDLVEPHHAELVRLAAMEPAPGGAGDRSLDSVPLTCRNTDPRERWRTRTLPLALWSCQGAQKPCLTGRRALARAAVGTGALAEVRR